MKYRNSEQVGGDIETLVSLLLYEARMTIYRFSSFLVEIYQMMEKIQGMPQFVFFQIFFYKSNVTFIKKMMKLEGRILLCHMIDRVEI